MRTDRMKEKVIQPATPSTGERERDEDDASGREQTNAISFLPRGPNHVQGIQCPHASTLLCSVVTTCLFFLSAMSRDDSEEPKEGRQHRLDSFIPGSSIGQNIEDFIQAHYFGIGKCKVRIPDFVSKIPTLGGTFEPQSKSSQGVLFWSCMLETLANLRELKSFSFSDKLYLAWLALVTTAYIYNGVASTLRPTFVTAEVFNIRYPYDPRTFELYNACALGFPTENPVYHLTFDATLLPDENSTFYDRWNVTNTSIATNSQSYSAGSQTRPGTHPTRLTRPTDGQTENGTVGDLSSDSTSLDFQTVTMASANSTVLNANSTDNTTGTLNVTLANGTEIMLDATDTTEDSCMVKGPVGTWTLDGKKLV